MQIKTTMRSHFTPTTMAVLKKIISNVAEGVEKSELSYTAGENIKWCNYIRKQSGNFSKDLNIELLYDLKILLGIYPREIKTCPHKNLYTNIHSSIIYN